MIKLTKEQYKALEILKAMDKAQLEQFLKNHEKKHK